MDDRFLIYTKMIVEITNYTILSQAIAVITNNIVELYNDENKDIIVKVADDIKDAISNIIEKCLRQKIPPQAIVLAMLLTTHDLTNELIELLTKNAEKFAERELDLKVNLGVKRGELRYEES